MKELILWLHIVSASFWVGGMLFLSLVIVPFLRDKPYKKDFFASAVQRFSFYGTFLSLGLLLITGLGITFYIQGGFRRTIYEKLFLFVVILIISLYHDLWAGPRALQIERYRKIARYIGIVNLILSLIMVYMGVRIRMGL